MKLPFIALLLLTACATQSAPSRHWRTVVDETGQLSLRMPSSFADVPKGTFFYVHGGQAWRDGEATVSVSFGQFAEYSFGDEPGVRRRVPIGKANVFVIEGPTSVLAWYDEGSGCHEPVVSVSTQSPERLKELAPIALSLIRLRPPCQ